MKVRTYPLKLDILSTIRRDLYLEKHRKNFLEAVFRRCSSKFCKPLCCCLFLIVWFICIFIKKRFQLRCFPVTFAEFFKTNIFYTSSGCFCFFKPWFFCPHLSSLAALIASCRSSRRRCSVRKGKKRCKKRCSVRETSAPESLFK